MTTTQTRPLTPYQVRRYSRHIIMPQVGSIGQRKLLDAKVLIVGAGYIATEFAGVLNALGSNVTLLLRKDTLLRGFDVVLRETVMDEMRQNGIEIITGTNIKALASSRANQLTVDCDGGKADGPFDAVIWAIGRTGQRQHDATTHNPPSEACPDTCHPVARQRSS